MTHPASNACFSESELEAYSIGALVPEAQKDVLEHLEQCEHCKSVSEQQQKDEQTPLATAESTSDSTDSEDDFLGLLREAYSETSLHDRHRIIESGSARQARMEFYYKKDPNSPISYPLRPESLPILSGSQVQLRISMDVQGYPFVALISPSGKIKQVYPKSESPQSEIRQLILPNEDNGWTLKGRPGTMTAVLLLSPKPITQEANYLERLAQFEKLPFTKSDSILRIEGKRAVLEKFSSSPQPLKRNGEEFLEAGAPEVGSMLEASELFHDMDVLFYALAISIEKGE